MNISENSCSLVVLNKTNEFSWTTKGHAGNTYIIAYFYSHTELTEYTETLLRMLFCESLRRLRETIPPHGSLLPSTSFQSRMALLTTNYSLIQLRTALVKID